MLALVGAVLPTLLLFANKGTVVLMGLVALAAAVDLWRGRAAGLPRLDRAVTWAMASVLAFGAISAAWEFADGLALHKIGQLAILTLGGLLIVLAATRLTLSQRSWALGAAVAGLLVSAGLVVVEAATGLALGHAVHWLIYQSEPGYGVMWMPRYKTAATIGAVLAVLVIGHSMMRRRYALAMIVLAAEILMARLTGSLTGLVALFVAASIAATALVGRKWPARMLAGALIAAFVLAPLAAWMPSPRTLIDTFSWAPNSALHRTAIWRFTAELVLERPLLGWGLDAAREVPGGEGKVTIYTYQGGAQPQPLDQQLMPLHPHNFILQVWLEGGLVGAGLMLALMLALLRLIERGPGTAPLLGTAVVAASLVVGAISFGVWQSWWLSTVWLIAGLTVASGWVRE